MCPLRLACCLIAVAAVAACTPVRSKLPPPYRVDGRSLSAVEMNQYAENWCTEAQGKIELPAQAFTTDGCSAWPESRGQSCCLAHDVAYWCGAGNRRAIDQAFRSCLRNESSAAYATLAYAGVRLGGGRFLPFPWRFGYGHRWPHRKPSPERMENVSVDSETSPQNPPTGH
jgi:hypothetical protein